MYTALKARIPFLDINRDRDFGYEIYTGRRERDRQLGRTTESPTGKAVRRPSPWSAVGAASAATAPPPQAPLEDAASGLKPLPREQSHA
jgi:nitrogenase molybdenum-cofactor synthesis protein NifE